MKRTVWTLIIWTLVAGCAPAKKRERQSTFVAQGQPQPPQSETIPVSAAPVAVETKVSEAAPASNPPSTPSASSATAPTTPSPVTAPTVAPTTTRQLQLPKSSANTLETLIAPLQVSQENQSRAAGVLNDDKKAAARVKAELNAAAAEAEKKSANTPVSEEDSVMWPKLVEYVADHGIKDESPTGFYVSLVWISNNDFRTPPHIDSRISIVGGFNEQNQFALTRMETVWADVKINADGNKDADQWMFLTSKTGAVARYWRYHLVKKPNDTVLVHQSLEVTEAEAKAKWDQLRKGWYKLIQQNPPPNFVTFEK